MAAFPERRRCRQMRSDFNKYKKVRSTSHGFCYTVWHEKYAYDELNEEKRNAVGCARTIGAKIRWCSCHVTNFAKLVPAATSHHGGVHGRRTANECSRTFGDDISVLMSQLLNPLKASNA